MPLPVCWTVAGRERMPTLRLPSGVEEGQAVSLGGWLKAMLFAIPLGRTSGFLQSVQAVRPTRRNNLITTRCDFRSSESITNSEEQVMSIRISVPIGDDPVQQQAAADGNAVQDTCNLTAV